MTTRTPITLITGPLGSGKTTLLRHILRSFRRKIAILMNEFGEIAIDSRIIEGRNVRMAELDGGCVCCSLLGEFEAAVREIIATVDPEWIIVETTGVAEPEALAFDIQESLPQIRLDGIITVADADAMVQFPSLGRTTRMQIESADAILLNKIDLVSDQELEEAEVKLRRLNEGAEVFRVEKCRADPDLLFGLGRERRLEKPSHRHQPQYESFTFSSQISFDRSCFEEWIRSLSPHVYRAKGFVRLNNEGSLFNFVGGRWDLEPFETEETTLVFIGEQLAGHKDEILAQLQRCHRGKGGSGEKATRRDVQT